MKLHVDSMTVRLAAAAAAAVLGLFGILPMRLVAQGGAYVLPYELTTPKRLVRATAGFENFRASLSYRGGGDSIIVVRNERANSVAPWHQQAGEYSVSYRVTAVASEIGGAVIYVAGVMPDDGSALIEKWTFPIPNGRWIHAPVSPALPGGYFGSTTIKGGGPFVAPLPERPWVVPEREILLRLHSLGPVQSMEVDANQRFLLIKTVQIPGIHKVDLLTNPVAVSLLFDSATFPNLPLLRSFATEEQFLPTGARRRLFIMTNSLDHLPPSQYGVLFDDNNDGNFDGHAHGSVAVWPPSTIGPSKRIEKHNFGIF